MSAASRQREKDRLHLVMRRGFPTWEAFREWQQSQIEKYISTPEVVARRAKVEEMLALGMVLPMKSETFVPGELYTFSSVLDIDPTTVLPLLT